MILKIGGLGGILTDIETVEEIAAMPKHPTNYPTNDHWQRVIKWIRHSRWTASREYAAGEVSCLGDINATAPYLAADIIEAQAARIAELEGALDVAEGKVGDAYQFAGNILEHAGLWGHPEAVRALDYFAGIDGADAPGDFLPWPRCDLAAPMGDITVHEDSASGAKCRVELVASGTECPAFCAVCGETGTANCPRSRKLSTADRDLRGASLPAPTPDDIRKDSAND